MAYLNANQLSSVDFATALQVNAAQAINNVSAATQIKVGYTRAVRVSVTTAGAAGAIYDSATVAGVGAANLIAVIPATVGIYSIDWPCTAGLVYVPGSAQVASIAFS